MAPIRKGDGTEVNLKGIQEVRTGDGRVFFEGGDAIPDNVVDNFEEDGGIYNDVSLSDVYAGDLDSFSRDSAGLNGDFVLKNDAEAGELIHSQPDDGLNRYPQDGETVQFILMDGVNVDSQMEASVCFMVEDDTNPSGYVFHFLPEIDRISISSTEDITSLTSSSEDDIAINSDVSELTTGEWFWFEAKLPSSENNEISLEVFEDEDGERGNSLEKISANNDDHIGQEGVGFHSTRTSGDDVSYVDIVEIIE